MARPRIDGYRYDERGRRYLWLACGICGKERWVRVNKISERCFACQPTGKDSHNWKGGRSKDNQGYIRVKLLPNSPFYSMAMKSGYVLEHRLVMAQYLGRPLLPSELVHHTKGIKDDNRHPETLQLKTRKTHKLSYTDGYNQGLIDGLKQREISLERQIKLLQWQIKELSEALKLKLEI